LAQVNFDSDDPTGHLRSIQEIIARNREHDLIVFPELILHGHPSPERPEGYLYRQIRARREDVVSRLNDFVREQDTRVILGHLARRGERFYNQAIYLDKTGVQRYTKTHVHWTEHFTPGDRLKVFQTPLGPLGINICFDSAFSEVWRVGALRGAQMAINISAVPAAFPVKYMHRRMVGAAIFNQLFVVYVNRPGPVFSGHSAVYSPTGETLAQAGGEPREISLEIDLAETAEWRDQERVYPHRRPLLYRRVSQRKKFSGIIKQPVRGQSRRRVS
jgi:predicted amidohydrolase